MLESLTMAILREIMMITSTPHQNYDSSFINTVKQSILTRKKPSIKMIIHIELKRDSFNRSKLSLLKWLPIRFAVQMFLSNALKSKWLIYFRKKLCERWDTTNVEKSLPIWFRYSSCFFHNLHEMNGEEYSKRNTVARKLI